MSAVATPIDAATRLAELAAVANDSFELATQMSRSALAHAIRAGEALLEAQKIVESGTWIRWLDANFRGSLPTANQYMRVAHYQDEIPDDCPGWTAAVELLRGRAHANGSIGNRSESVKREAVAKYEAGATFSQVGAEYGVSPSTVHYWVNRAERLHRDKAARRALRDKERSDAVRRIGGSIAEGYSMLRRTAQVLDRAATEATDREVRAAVQDALAALYAAEDNIVRALRVSP